MEDSCINQFERRLQLARNEGQRAIAGLLDSYRHYLRLLARVQLCRNVQVRVSASDVAQESIVAAQRAFAGFAGTTERELVAWLRKVLASRLVDTIRFHSAQRRDIYAEQRLDESVEQSSVALCALLPDSGASPSQIVQQREEVVLLSEALERLPNDYSEVIVQRHLENKSFAEISDSMDRTVPSVKALWARAMASLRKELGASQS
ncbi:MAG: sigma-70 family RNA polymerase sigma factor [Planctomycetales bacterium]|nr:sigma-70 family RNA polymerase sigma factor [Planctomycetales bacterium]